MSAEFSDALLYKCLTTDTVDSDGSLGHTLQYSSEEDSRSSLVPTANLCSEEQMLDRAFRECDSEGNGKVSALQIIEYLKSLTDPSRDEESLQHLQKMFDTNHQDNLVDFQTFCSVMSQWIASRRCNRDQSLPLEDDIFEKDLEQQDSGSLTYREDNINKQFTGSAQLEEHVGHIQSGEKDELMSKIADLTLTHKKLTDVKSKMQRNLEIADETNAELTEELVKVKGLLKSTRHALHQTLSIRSELEDLKTFNNDLENRINRLCAEKKELEKETLKLSSQKQSLQEENDKLLTEKEKTQERLDDCCDQNSKLLLQVCKYENLLLEMEDSLVQKNLQLEELQALVEEYKSLSKELKREKYDLENQLSEAHEDTAIIPHLSLNQCASTRPEASVCNELQDILESPRCLVQMKCAWEPYASELNTESQIDTQGTLSPSRRAWSCTDFLILRSLIWLKTHLTGYSRGSKILLLVFLYSCLFISVNSGEPIWTVIAGILQPHIQLNSLTTPPF